MSIVVQKYGGSSLADVGRVCAVAQQVVERSRSGDSVVVVVSAMGKTTDGLIRQAREVSLNPPRRELDMLVTAGERISMALICMAIHELGEEAISFTGSQSGIITESSHQGARIIEVRPFRLEQALETGKIVIVAGYQGVSLDREVTTLGRGGSDTSAVALAAALGATSCEIYSDVDGVYDADPNVCPQAKLIPEVGYETMQGMSSVGAKVLNAEAVEFARRANIKIVARKTGDTSERRTEVVSHKELQATGVTAVVGAIGVSRLSGSVDDMGSLLAGIERTRGRLFGVGGAAGGEWWVHRTDIPERSPLPLEEVARSFGLLHWDGAVVTVVGTSLLDTRLGQAEAALLEAGIKWVGLLASDSSLMFALAQQSCDKGVRELHRLFLQGESGDSETT